jgi:hypothetical protein
MIKWNVKEFEYRYIKMLSDQTTVSYLWLVKLQCMTFCKSWTTNEEFGSKTL